MPIALKVFIYRLAIYTAAAPAMILWVVCRAVHSFYPVTIHLYRSNRIGHQCADLELLLRQRTLGQKPKKGGEIFLTQGPANQTYLKISRRRVVVIANEFFVELAKKIKQLTGDTKLIVPLPAHIQPHGVFQATAPQLILNAADHRRGQEKLAEMGLPAGLKYICFHCRDDSYLRKKFPHQNWSYHSYRDSSIHNYVLAAETMAEKNLWAVRMGELTAEKITATSARVIDYAAKHRSDFGDVFLSATCKFFLGTNCGLSNVASCFNVPIAWVNVAPLGTVPWRAEDVFIPKKVRDKDSGRILSFREVIACGADSWGLQRNFDEAGMAVVENTPEEIRDVALEMNARIDGTWQESPEDALLQKRFRSLWPAGHLVSGFKSRIGAKFLRDNQALLS